MAKSSSEPGPLWWAKETFLSDNESSDVMLLTQTLEGDPSMWANCSALTITIRPHVAQLEAGQTWSGLPEIVSTGKSSPIAQFLNKCGLPGCFGTQPTEAPSSREYQVLQTDIRDAKPDYSPCRVDVIVSSRCGSGKGEIRKTLRAVQVGDCYELVEKGVPQFMVGHLGGQEADRLWIEGAICIDLPGLYSVDAQGVDDGDLAAGDDKVEVFGVQKDIQGSCKERWQVSMLLLFCFTDPFLDINNIYTFLESHAYPAAVVCAVLNLFAMALTVSNLRKVVSSKGSTICEFLSQAWLKSRYGGIMIRDVMMLKVFDFGDFTISHFVVAYGIFDERSMKHHSIQWSLSMGLSIFSIIYVCKDMAFCTSAMTEHIAQVSRIRFLYSQPGKKIYDIMSGSSMLGNPVLMATILSNALNAALPRHSLGFNIETVYITSLYAAILGSWILFGTVVPHWYFLGKFQRPQHAFDMWMYLVQCNVDAEAPVMRKRHPWSPWFHLYRFILRIVWKVAVWMICLTVIPDAYGYYQRRLTLGSFGEGITITPTQAIIMAWFLAAVVTSTCDLFMLIAAQTGYAYPGMSFFAPCSRVTISAGKPDYRRSSLRKGIGID